MLATPLATFLGAGRRATTLALSSLSNSQSNPTSNFYPFTSTTLHLSTIPSPSFNTPALSTAELPEAAQFFPQAPTHDELHRSKYIVTPCS